MLEEENLLNEDGDDFESSQDEQGVELTHRKPKKTRRGKKKLKLTKAEGELAINPDISGNNLNNSKSDSEDLLCNESNEINDNHKASPKSEEGTLKKGSTPDPHSHSSHKKRKKRLGGGTKRSRRSSESHSHTHDKGVRLRPVNVPKAPENSTQFIIDDHEDCNLYVSFEAEAVKNYKKRNIEVNLLTGSPQIYSAENESSSELDMTTFFEKDFELIYRRAKEEEMMALSRDELIAQVVGLERKALELDAKLKSTGLLGRLQQQLLMLQEQNKRLRAESICLKGLQKTDLDSDIGMNSFSSMDEDDNLSVHKDVFGSDNEGENVDSRYNDAYSRRKVQFGYNDEIINHSENDNSTETDSSSDSSLSDCGSSCSECEAKRASSEVITNGNYDENDNLEMLNSDKENETATGSADKIYYDEAGNDVEPLQSEISYVSTSNPLESACFDIENKQDFEKNVENSIGTEDRTCENTAVSSTVDNEVNKCLSGTVNIVLHPEEQGVSTSQEICARLSVSNLDLNESCDVNKLNEQESAVNVNAESTGPKTDTEEYSELETF